MKTTILLFGATGDLAVRKLIPAIHDVAVIDQHSYTIVGIAYDVVDAASMMASARSHVRDLDAEAWALLCERAQVIRGDFNDPAVYEQLAQLQLDGNILVYCATRSDFFIPITQMLVQYGVIKRQEEGALPWARIAYEKPFGLSSASAQAINSVATSLLDESQIFRVDHYLGKKATAALPAMRMLDETFNRLWVNADIAFLQVIVHESSGIGTRGGYYDSAGALADMVQNHLLQIVSLLVAHDPLFDYPHLTDEKKKSLAALSIVDGVLGQYVGYTREPHVAADSKTETFAALRLSADIGQWKNVPVFVKTGKGLKDKKMVIYLVLKSQDTSRVADMHLAVVAYSDNEVGLVIGRKEIEAALSPEGCGPVDESETLDAYGRMLEFITQGDRTLFVAYEEIARSWEIVEAFKGQAPVVHAYEPGSVGPQALDEFNKKHGVEWLL